MNLLLLRGLVPVAHWLELGCLFFHFLPAKWECFTFLWLGWRVPGSSPAQGGPPFFSFSFFFSFFESLFDPVLCFLHFLLSIFAHFCPFCSLSLFQRGSGFKSPPGQDFFFLLLFSLFLGFYLAYIPEKPLFPTFFSPLARLAFFWGSFVAPYSPSLPKLCLAWPLWPLSPLSLSLWIGFS